MDYIKIGRLIAQLRKEKSYTQQQLAAAMNISNKTISKWERGLGCPDVSLWRPLADLLGADIHKMLEGELKPNRLDAGRIDKIQFYVCPTCANILTSTQTAAVTCCGRPLEPLPKAVPTSGHEIRIEEVDLDYYISLDHAMSKEHYLLFTAYVKSDMVILNRLYPEQQAAVRIPAVGYRGSLYLYCTRHGLQVYRVEKPGRL